MFEDDELLTALPPRRDDEPPTLRAQIAAELHDHLACAFHRELVKTGRADVARARVLEQFGDPRGIARQLWFQAMRSRIMSQRWIVGGTLVAALSALFGVGLMGWFLLELRADATRQQTAMLELLAGMKAELTQRPQAAIPLTRVPVRIRCVREDDPTQGVAGVMVQISKTTTNPGQALASLTEGFTDETGIVELGYLDIDRYRISLVSPVSQQHSGYITITPGTDFLERIVIPAWPKQSIAHPLKLELPETLVKFQLAYRFTIQPLPLRVNGRDWLIARIHGSVFPSAVSSWSGVVTADGRCWLEEPAESETVAPVSPPLAWGRPLFAPAGAGGPPPNITACRPAREIMLPIGDYHVSWGGWTWVELPDDDEAAGTLLGAIPFEYQGEHPQEAISAITQDGALRLAPPDDYVRAVALWFAQQNYHLPGQTGGAIPHREFVVTTDQRLPIAPQVAGDFRVVLSYGSAEHRLRPTDDPQRYTLPYWVPSRHGHEPTYQLRMEYRPPAGGDPADPSSYLTISQGSRHIHRRRYDLHGVLDVVTTVQPVTPKLILPGLKPPFDENDQEVPWRIQVNFRRKRDTLVVLDGLIAQYSLSPANYDTLAQTWTLPGGEPASSAPFQLPIGQYDVEVRFRIQPGNREMALLDLHGPLSGPRGRLAELPEFLTEMVVTDDTTTPEIAVTEEFIQRILARVPFTEGYDLVR